ncbi:hypothetical protein MRX96_014501 [Rhipicephalus microplus]
MRVRAEPAPVKGGSAAVRPANGTDHRGGIGIRDTSSTQAAALATVGRPRTRSTVRPPAETRHYKRRHGETADHEPSALRRQSDVTTAPPSGVLHGTCSGAHLVRGRRHSGIVDGFVKGGVCGVNEPGSRFQRAKRPGAMARGATGEEV